MSVNQPQETKRSPKLKIHMYFSWADRLWYVVDLSFNKDQAFLEDCNTEETRWVPTKLFRNRMKEVKLTSV